MVGMTIGRWLLAASLAAGCGHHPTPPLSNPPADLFDRMPRAGDERLPIRSNADVIGRYGPQGEVAVEENALGGLSIVEHGHRTEMSPSGTELIRRGDRIFLRVLWCYREVFYERRH
jgi:hypothetical protein